MREDVVSKQDRAGIRDIHAMKSDAKDHWKSRG
jgi:hypothetical protein